MSQLVAQLIELINKEVESFEKMLDLLLSEQNSLVENDAEALQKNLAQQERLVSHIRSLEEERIKLTETIARQIGTEPAELTLRKLASRLKGTENMRLQDVGNSLLQLQRKIQMTNRNNQILIRQSLKYINQSLDILTGAKGLPRIYAKTGKIAQNAGAQNLMNKSA